MSMTGDFAKLRKLKRELKVAAGDKLIKDMTRAARTEVKEQYQGDFANQADPFGNPWPATRTGKTPVLYTSGRLANPSIVATKGTIRLRPVRYGWYHHMGANNMAERMIAPFTKGSKWDPPIERAINDVMDDHFATAEG